MGTPLRNPPVFFTIAQVRFNAVLKLAEFIPTVQDAMRRAGFPDFRSDKTLSIEIRIQDGRPNPTPVQNERFMFGNAAQTHLFIVGTNFLTLQSTDYGRFEEFSEAFMAGLGRLHDAVQLDFTERVGLRYLDYVVPRAGEELAQYLAPEVLGLSTRIGGAPVHGYSETLTKVEDMMLLSRVAVQEGGLAFPPDVSPDGMVITARFLVPASGKQATLDNDGYVEEREVFDLQTIANRLSRIHKMIGAAWRVAATNFALDVWDSQ